VALIRFDTTRLGSGDVIAGVGSVALMVGIFLPWFEFGSSGTGYFSFDATALRSWMYLPFVLALAVVGYLLVTAIAGRSRLPGAHRLLLVGVCGADLVLTLACFAKKESGLSWDVGAYVSLVAACVALVGAVVRSVERPAPAAGAYPAANRRRRDLDDPVVPVSPSRVNPPPSRSQMRCRSCGKANSRVNTICDSCGQALHR
jgi:hypothetical protein